MPDGTVGPRRAPFIGGVRMDIEGYRLLDATGRDVSLRPKSFEVLRVLAERCGTVVGRGELLDLVWGDVHVTDDSITQCIMEIRRALGSRSGAVIRTIPRRGYMLDVRPDVPRGGSCRACVAVLPFRGLGGAAAARLGAALAEDLSVELARLKLVTVILPGQAGAGADAGAMSGGAGTVHRLYSSVRLRRRGWARITAQLVHSDQRSVIWARSVDCKAAEPLFLEGHDALVSKLARAICSAVQAYVAQFQVRSG